MSFILPALAEDYTYNPASDVTTSVSDKLTGEGKVVKTGEGVLVLSNGENDYSGGTVVNGGIVRVTAVGALGSGLVTVDGKNQKVELSAPKAAEGYNVYANDFLFTGTGNGLASGGGTDSTYSLWFGPEDKTAKLKLTGKITADRGLRMRTYNTTTSPGDCEGPEVVIMGEVNAGNNPVYVESYGIIAFSNKVTAALMMLGDAWSTGGKVYLSSPENEVGEWRIGNERVYCTAENVLSGGMLDWDSHGNNPVDGRSILDLQGFKQTVSCIFSPVPNSSWDQVFTKYGNYLCVKSTPPATLTITGRSEPAQTYTTIRDAVSLVLDASEFPDFEQSFMLHPNTMTGTITVKNGTLRLAETARFAKATALTIEKGGTFKCESTATSAALAGVKTLKIAGTFDASSATVNPFAEELDEIELVAGAVVKLPAVSIIRSKRVKIGDKTYTGGCLVTVDGMTLEDVAIEITGTATTTATWTDGAADGLLATAGNWDGAIDLGLGTARAVFASAGSAATVDTDMVAAGITFDSAQGFTLSRLAKPQAAKTITVFDDIAVLGSGDGARTYTIDNPLKFVGNRTITLDGNSTLCLKNALASDDAAKGTITVKSSSLVFEGTNTFAGRLAITTNRVTIKAGVLANPNRERGTRPASDSDANTIYLNVSSAKDADLKNTGIQLQNAVVDKSLYIKNRMGTCAVYAPENTTNEIRGFVRYTVSDTHERFSLNDGSELTLSGGLETIHSFRIYDGGTLRITNTPALFLGSAGLNPSEGTVYLDVANNTITNMCIGYHDYKTATIVTTVDYAMTNGNVQVGGDGGYFGDAVAPVGGSFTLDLRATKQKCQRLGVMKQGVLTGQYPAMLEITEGRPSEGLFAKFGYSVVGQVTGGVGLCMNGDEGSVLLLTNQVFASCGDLMVTNGILELAEATWKNGTNVTVTGTGILKVSKLRGGVSAFDGKHAVLHLGDNDDTWTIDLPAGSVQRFAYAYDSDGKLLPSGVYGRKGAQGVTREAYSDHFPENGGTIRVTRHGTTMIFR